MHFVITSYSIQYTKLYDIVDKVMDHVGIDLDHIADVAFRTLDDLAQKIGEREFRNNFV